MILIKFLFFFFFIFLLLIVMMGFSLIRGVKRMFGSKNSQQQQYRQPHSNAYTSRERQRNTQSSYAEEAKHESRYHHRKKIYAHDEGEYVDYEEVKD